MTASTARGSNSNAPARSSPPNFASRRASELFSDFQTPFRLPSPSFLLAFTAQAHDHRVPAKPTKAQADLDRSRKSLTSAKRALAAQGRYACCAKPSCDLCAPVPTGLVTAPKTSGTVEDPAANASTSWRAGRGAVKGVNPKSVELLPADRQACPMPAHAAHPADQLRVSAESLLRAKRTLLAEGRYSCCIRGGCAECADETSCPCGADLAAHKGVCGECLDGWRSGRGAFAAIDPAEVTLALFGGWTLSASGQLFGVYSNRSVPRGRDKIFSTNWVMALAASRRAGPGTLTFRSMLSAGTRHHYRQALPADLRHRRNRQRRPHHQRPAPARFLHGACRAVQDRARQSSAIHFYGGPRGEPSLGPPAYPHRASASENPIPQIFHHMQDSTHIATNVITAGVSADPSPGKYRAFTVASPTKSAGESRAAPSIRSPPASALTPRCAGVDSSPSAA